MADGYQTSLPGSATNPYGSYHHPQYYPPNQLGGLPGFHQQGFQPPPSMTNEFLVQAYGVPTPLPMGQMGPTAHLGALQRVTKPKKQQSESQRLMS